MRRAIGCSWIRKLPERYRRIWSRRWNLLWTCYAVVLTLVLLVYRSMANRGFALDLRSEIRGSIVGGPMDYMDDYKNPCWMGVLREPNPYKDNRYQRLSETYPGLGSFFGSVALANMTTVFRRRLSDDHESWRVRCLPYLFLAGVTKSGTTDLFQKLIAHPDIVPAAIKEPMWWNSLSGVKPRLDATPDYLWKFDGWQKMEENRGLKEPKTTLAHMIKNVIPRAKIVVILRNPIDRLYSHFRKDRERDSPSAFHRDAQLAVQRMERCLGRRTLRSCAYDSTVNTNEFMALTGGVFVRASLYYPFVRDWLSVFGPDQLLVLRAEDYYHDRTSALREVYRFLGLRPISADQLRTLDSSPVVNSRRDFQRSTKPMLNSTRTLLSTFFQPFNEKLADLLGDSRFLWTDSHTHR